MKKVFGVLLLTIILLVGTQAALAQAEYVELVGRTNVYYGQMVDGEMNGFGIYHDSTGVVYYGEFENTKVMGVGINIYPDNEPSGTVHRSGTFYESKSNGENTILLNNGIRFVSSYENGALLPGKRSITEGKYEWKERLDLPGGDWYMGEVLRGTITPEGYGVKFYVDGGIYAGEFAAGNRHGLGIYMDAHKNSVSATWQNDLAVQARRMVYVDEAYPLDWVFQPERQEDVKEPLSLEEMVDSVVKSVYFVRACNVVNLEFSTGSGFVAFDDELFVTNHHVIEDAAYLIVVSDDGEEYVLDELLYASKEEDVAILRFPKEAGATALPCNTAKEVKRGQEVVAIGSPLGMKNTVSVGHISGFDRPILAKTPSLQFTAPVSHGSSGGALFNMEGEVIGVVYSGKDGGQNLNYAIPISVVENLQRQENYHPQKLNEYNNIGEAIPKIQNLSATADDGAIVLGWDSMANVSRYLVVATNPEDEEQVDTVGEIVANNKARQQLKHAQSKAYPTFFYTYAVFALDKEDTIVGVASCEVAVFDLAFR